MQMPLRNISIIPTIRHQSMTNLHGTTHITPAGGNIFLDLGFEPIEAALLYAESKAIIERRRHVDSLFAIFPQAPGCLDAPDMIATGSVLRSNQFHRSPGITYPAFCTREQATEPGSSN
jgi:hypothetical protein